MERQVAPYVGGDGGEDYLPGQIESKFHGTKLFPLNSTEKSPKSFFYIVGNDNSDVKKCMVRVVHFFQEVEPKG